MLSLPDLSFFMIYLATVSTAWLSVQKFERLSVTHIVWDGYDANCLQPQIVKVKMLMSSPAWDMMRNTTWLLGSDGGHPICRGKGSGRVMLCPVKVWLHVIHVSRWSAGPWRKGMMMTGRNKSWGDVGVPMDQICHPYVTIHSESLRLGDFP